MHMIFRPRYIPFALLFLALLGAGAWFLLRDRAPQETGNDRGIDRLLAENRGAIDRAMNAEAEAVPPLVPTDRIQGRADAPVVLIVYEDFECGFCAGYQETLKAVREKFPDQVVIAYRHYPLRNHLNAFAAAVAAECAAAQDRFFPMRDALYAANRAGTLGPEAYAAAAATLGLDAGGFAACLDDPRHSDRVQEEAQAVRGLVSGTPASFINGEPAPGAVPFEDFVDSQNIQREGLRSIIERHLQNS